MRMHQVEEKELGVVVLDSNTMRHLLTVHEREQFSRCVRRARAEVWPNAIGVLELIRTPDKNLRAQLLGALADLCSKRSVRPLPSEVLRLTGQMLIDGSKGFEWPSSGFEFLLYQPSEIRDEHVAAARDRLCREKETFEELHRRARKTLRPLLDEATLRAGEMPLREFLDHYWIQPSIVEPFVEFQWTALGLTGSLEARTIIGNEAWRLSLEGFGASIYERALMNNSPRPVHSADIRQLVYLAGSHHATLVTEDKPLQRVADGILSKHYRDTRVMSMSQFLSLST